MFTTSGSYNNMAPDAFYNLSNSTTAQFVSAAPPTPYITNGISMNGDTFTDYFCLDNSTSIETACYIS